MLQDKYMEEELPSGLDSSSNEGEDYRLLSENGHSIRRLTKSSRWRIIFGIMVLLGTNLLTGFLTWRLHSPDSILESIERLSGYSPLYRNIDIHIDDIVADQSQFWDNWDNETTIWRQEPSKEVDAAWDEISTSRPLLLTREEVVKLGKDPERTVQWPYDSAGDLYLGQMNAFHLNHCLDQMRRAIFVEHYGRSDDPTYWTHVKHCIDIIRQELMCTASLDVTVLAWADVQDAPFPDFELHRKCRRWEDIVSYRNEHILDKAKAALINTIPKPHGVKEWNQPRVGHELLAKSREWSAKHPDHGSDHHH